MEHKEDGKEAVKNVVNRKHLNELYTYDKLNQNELSLYKPEQLPLLLNK